MSRRFDAGLGGLGFNEFILLLHLSQAPDEKMRRIELADKLGLTASGVTRLLLPMEKVGLVKREVNEFDARVIYSVLGEGGKEKLMLGLENAEALAEETYPSSEKLQELSSILVEMGGVFE